MVFNTQIKQFDAQGEKTGWTYIEIPTDVSDALSPESRRSFYVKGRLDKWKFRSLPLMPMGGGVFILTLNAAVRRAIGKRKGAMVEVELHRDKPPVVECPELNECLADDPDAGTFFESLTPSHRNYFIKWINSAKTEATKTKRITQTVIGLGKHLDYGSTIRYFRQHPES